MYGLVLEGGGSKGAYHIGAYKALVEEEIGIGGVVGTSVGALNGAMIVQGDYQKAYEIWHEISYSKIIKAKDGEIERIRQIKLDKEDLSLLTKKVKEDFIKKTIRHYGAATPENLMKEAEKEAQLQQEVELVKNQYKSACKIAGIETEEDRASADKRRELIKIVADCVAVASIFFAGVLSAKKYFNKK